MEADYELRRHHPNGGERGRHGKNVETAQMLADIAMKAQMKIYDVDRETARDWVIRAAEAVH